MIKMVVIGGSAGSLEVILQMLPLLSPALRVPLVLVLHRKATTDNILTELLAGRTTLDVKEIEEKETPQPGGIYIVPPDYHLLFEADHSFSLDYSERVNYSRPSIDVVYESAAFVFGDRLACILLSGANSDGTEGMKSIRKAGGITIAQDPETAEVPFMPRQAILGNAADHVWNVAQMVAFLNEC